MEGCIKYRILEVKNKSDIIYNTLAADRLIYFTCWEILID